MALWLVRAGSNGERQDFALDNGCVVFGADQIPNSAQYKTREAMAEAWRSILPDASQRKISNHAGQLWSFTHVIRPGDKVALPLKGQNAIAFGRVTGNYRYDPDGPSGAKHQRPVEWIVQDFPRDRLDQDILYSLGAFMTVCQISRNDAEARVEAVLQGQPAPLSPEINESLSDSTESTAPPDLAEYAQTQIRSYIRSNFDGHEFARLIDAILTAQGYRTEVSPPGPDGGVDIVAGRGAMGFDPPRLCVQVKSGTTQQDVKVLRELKGVMIEFGADQGLFVAWGGFTRNAKRESHRRFFEVRLWDAGDVVDEVLKHYEQFPETLKAELPLRRIWTLVPEDGG